MVVLHKQIANLLVARHNIAPVWAEYRSAISENPIMGTIFRLVRIAAVVAPLGAPALLTPSPSHADWHGQGGWHGRGWHGGPHRGWYGHPGWYGGWRGGVFIGPPVIYRRPPVYYPPPIYYPPPGYYVPRSYYWGY
jgi:hypothetical protein